jgi:N-acetylglucosamine-6-phosphate deacetylase
MTVLTNARIVAEEAIIERGWVRIERGKIAAVGAGYAWEGPDPIDADHRGDVVDLGGAWLLPGFIDLHVHGGGGHDMTSSPADLAGAVAFHRRHGTTRTLASLVAAPPDDLIAQLGWIADRAERGPAPDGHVAGAHLEGPFLSRAHRGAQNSQYLLAPDRTVLADLLGAARGWLRSMTIAPELPGALELIADLREAGVVAAIGHTNADYDQTRAALSAGAGLMTHLFDGMPPLHHRAPGPVGAALESGVPAEIISDGVHLHPSLVAVAARAGSPLALITDAIAAAGQPDGSFTLAGQAVRVVDGAARVADGGSLAGSTLTMDRALRRAVRHSGLSISAASAAASAVPARVLGQADRCGAIAAGLDADLVVLDEDLRLRRVMAMGAWCPTETETPGGLQ